MISIIQEQKKDEKEVIRLKKEIKEGLTQLAEKTSSHLRKKPEQTE